MLSNKTCPGNSGKSHHKRKRLLIVSVLIFLLLFPYSILAQQSYSTQNNYEASSLEIIQGLLEKEVTPLASIKFQKSIIHFTLFILNSVSHTFIHSYQIKATYHDKPMKVILRL
jgi:hypothetical protein